MTSCGCEFLVGSEEGREREGREGEGRGGGRGKGGREERQVSTIGYDEVFKIPNNVHY